MDAPDCDRVALADALEVLGRASRRLGGDRLLRRQVVRVLGGRSPGPVSIVDIGTGGGDSALSVATHLRRRGWKPTLVLADLHAATLSICRSRVESAGVRAGVEYPPSFVRLDAAALPFASRSFDIAVSSLTLHHLEDEDALMLLKELARVGRWGWAVTDLRRSRLAYAAVRLLSATAWRRHPFPREDGPVSILRSFTPTEIRRLTRRTDGLEANVETRFVRWAARGTCR